MVPTSLQNSSEHSAGCSVCILFILFLEARYMASLPCERETATWRMSKEVKHRDSWENYTTSFVNFKEFLSYISLFSFIQDSTYWNHYRTNDFNCTTGMIYDTEQNSEPPPPWLDSEFFHPLPSNLPINKIILNASPQTVYQTSSSLLNTERVLSSTPEHRTLVTGTTSRV